MSDSRRGFLGKAAAGLSGLALAGCDKVADSRAVLDIVGRVDRFTKAAQRLLIGDALAPEYPESMISAAFRANGSTSVDDEHYQALAKKGFAVWHLKVDGLVEKPLSLSLKDLRAMPSRTQVTRHDCVEGWSCIGKWQGVPLAAVLDDAKPKADAKYLVFHCADSLEEDDAGKPVPFYGTIDLTDARHPQTILAYDMNDKPLPVPYGAPLRLRLERQLGYKMSKYIMRIEAVADFANIGDGKGGYWEDRGYDWYAGI